MTHGGVSSFEGFFVQGRAGSVVLGACRRAEDARYARSPVHVGTREGPGADVIELLGVGRASRTEPPRGEDFARRGHACWRLDTDWLLCCHCQSASAGVPSSTKALFTLVHIFINFKTGYNNLVLFFIEIHNT